MKDGRRFGGPPTPYEPPAIPAGKINITDLDCRPMKARRGFIQGYNAQAVVNADRIILAAELGTRSPDFGLLGPTVTAVLAELDAVGVSDVPGVVLADTGYWHQDQMDELRIERGIEVLIPPDAATARPAGRAGTAGATRSCAASCRPTSAKRSTAAARR